MAEWENYCINTGISVKRRRKGKGERDIDREGERGVVQFKERKEREWIGGGHQSFSRWKRKKWR